jgi:hypothetical protein
VWERISTNQDSTRECERGERRKRRDENQIGFSPIFITYNIIIASYRIYNEKTIKMRQNRWVSLLKRNKMYLRKPFHFLLKQNIIYLSFHFICVKIKRRNGQTTDRWHPYVHLWTERTEKHIVLCSILFFASFFVWVRFFFGVGGRSKFSVVLHRYNAQLDWFRSQIFITDRKVCGLDLWGLPNTCMK